MKILVVSATEKEVLSLKNKLDLNRLSVCTLKYTAIKDFAVDFVVTGIGSVFTTYALLKTLTIKKYDLVINAGIAGSFSSDLQIGEVVYVRQDQFADLGIEENSSIKTLFEKGFMQKNEFPFTNATLENQYANKLTVQKEGLKQVSGITVNTTHGSNESITLYKNKFNADIETMEGAAVFYVCFREEVNCLQIRSISNYVVERNEAEWNIPLAIKNLNDKLFEIMDVLKRNS